MNTKRTPKFVMVMITAIGLLLLTLLPLGIWRSNVQAQEVEAQHIKSVTATFTVNSTIDAVDNNPGDGVCSTSTNVCTLRAAIQETNALAGDDTITLPIGTYTLTIAGENEEGAATGDLDIDGNLIINGSNANDTIVDGNSLDRVFDIRNSHNVVFANVTIQNGRANDTSFYHFGGGAIRGRGDLLLNSVVLKNNMAVDGNVGGAILIFGGTTLTIIDSTIRDNTASASGGAIDHNLTIPTTSIIIKNSTLSGNNAYRGGAISSGQGSISLENTQFIDNSASLFGGAIESFYGSISLKNTQFVDNSAGSLGGALRLSSILHGEIIDTVFRQNIANHGGGIHSAGENNSLVITRTNFISNTATSSWGGGLYMTGLTSTLSIADSTFSQNSSSSGGAIGLYAPGPTFGVIGVSATINNSSFIENDAQFGGGALIQSVGTSVSINNSAFISNTADNGGAMHSTSDGMTGGAIGYITNSTFSGNHATSSGGAIYGSTLSTDISLRNVTIAFNTASNNGGGVNLFNGTTFVFRDSLIANNVSGGTGPDCYADSGFLSITNNLVGKIDGCTFTPDSGDLVGSIIDPLDPMLQSLMGSPAYHPLSISSPAIDAGFSFSCLSTDQIGSIRPIDGNSDGTSICDIGAIEAPERISVTATASTEATLIYSDTQGNPTSIQIPANAVTETTMLIYSPVHEITAPSGFMFANHAFDMNAYRNNMLLPDFVFELPVTLTISYSDADLGGLDETKLAIFYLNGNNWEDATCGSYTRDIDMNRLSAPICHLSHFSLFGEGQSVYLPTIMR